MRLSPVSLIPILMLCACPVWADAPSLADTFPLGIYWPWERVGGLAERVGLEKWDYVERCLDDMKAHHADSLWVVNLNIPDLPLLAERVAARDMTLIPALAELHYNVPWRRNNWEYLETQSRRALEAAGDSPAILAWALCDEPRKHFTDEMELYRQKFHEWGAKQPAVVVTMWGDTPAYAEQTDFAAVCPDPYPFFAPGNPNGPNTPGASRSWYRRHALIAARAAYDNGTTPWIMPQAYHEVWGPWDYDDDGNAVILPGGILHWRPPTPAEMRWQVWSAVAAGIRGFYWFCYAPPPQGKPGAAPYVGPIFPPALAVKEPTPTDFSGALIRPDGSATAQYEAVAEAFAALRPLIPLLTGAVPAEAPLAEVEAPGWVGTLHNPALQRTFIVLVNDDPDREQALKVWAVHPRDLRDLRSGAVLDRGEDNTVTVTLPPGDGTVLEPVL